MLYIILSAGHYEEIYFGSYLEIFPLGMKLLGIYESPTSLPEFETSGH